MANKLKFANESSELHSKRASFLDFRGECAGKVQHTKTVFGKVQARFLPVGIFHVSKSKAAFLLPTYSARKIL
jgi:hypothetical protein